MLTVKRYHQFEESKNIWHEVEQQSSHYPFQEWWYQNLFAKNFSVAESIIILAVCENEKPIAIAAFEKVDSSIQFLGTKHVLNGQDITDFGDILIDKAYSGNKDEIWATIVNNLRKDGSQLELKAVREDSVTFTYFKKNFNRKKQKLHRIFYYLNRGTAICKYWIKKTDTNWSGKSANLNGK